MKKILAIIISLWATNAYAQCHQSVLELNHNVLGVSQFTPFITTQQFNNHAQFFTNQPFIVNPNFVQPVCSNGICFVQTPTTSCINGQCFINTSPIIGIPQSIQFFGGSNIQSLNARIQESVVFPNRLNIIGHNGTLLNSGIIQAPVRSRGQLLLVK